MHCTFSKQSVWCICYSACNRIIALQLLTVRCALLMCKCHYIYLLCHSNLTVYNCIHRWNMCCWIALMTCYAKSSAVVTGVACHLCNPAAHIPPVYAIIHSHCRLPHTCNGTCTHSLEFYMRFLGLCNADACSKILTLSLPRCGYHLHWCTGLS